MAGNSKGPSGGVGGVWRCVTRGLGMVCAALPPEVNPVPMTRLRLPSAGPFPEVLGYGAGEWAVNRMFGIPAITVAGAFQLPGASRQRWLSFRDPGFFLEPLVFVGGITAFMLLVVQDVIST